MQTEEALIADGETEDDFVDETDIYFAPSNAWLGDKCMQFGLDFTTNVSRYRHAIQNIQKFKILKPDDVTDVAADGHCGFRTLSLLLCGDESYHGVVREAVCSFIADDVSIDESKHIFSKAKAIARAKLEIDTSEPIWDRSYWMNDADLAAAAALFQCNIFVYNIDKNWQCYSPQTYQSGTMQHTNFNPAFPTLLMDNSAFVINNVTKKKMSSNHFSFCVKQCLKIYL